MAGVLKALEETLADAQRVDTKAQSALDLKKQNLKDETKKRKELVKNMEEVKYVYGYILKITCVYNLSGEVCIYIC